MAKFGCLGLFPLVPLVFSKLGIFEVSTRLLFLMSLSPVIPEARSLTMFHTA